MRLPAIRANIGIWRYYITSVSFDEISRHVRKVDDELHKSRTLSEMIQRSITDNYLSIKDYILEQDERFFNALVLAVYDGEPQWIEVELNYQDDEFFNLGFLEFTGKEKIFPVDGQHRVEGIKAAVQENSQLLSEKIPVVLIGHRNTNEGRERTRRLFSTLNRYAKPVTMNDIIALDEDDIIAIVTRDLMENDALFQGNRIIYGKQKQIPKDNKDALTSIITLYECNKELFKYYSNLKGKNLSNYLKKRPHDKEIYKYYNFCKEYWKAFSEQIEVIRDYLNIENNAAKKYRNKNGGNLLFRPIGILPFIQASIEIKRRSNQSFRQIFSKLNDVELVLNKKPWKQVLWNEYENKMLSSDNPLVKSLLIFLSYKELLKEDEINKMKKSYAAKVSFEGDLDDLF